MDELPEQLDCKGMKMIAKNSNYSDLLQVAVQLYTLRNVRNEQLLSHSHRSPATMPCETVGSSLGVSSLEKLSLCALGNWDICSNF